MRLNHAKDELSVREALKTGEKDSGGGGKGVGKTLNPLKGGKETQGGRVSGSSCGEKSDVDMRGE